MELELTEENILLNAMMDANEVCGSSIATPPDISGGGDCVAIPKGTMCPNGRATPDPKPLSGWSVATLPKRVFIVPYRNRAQHKFFFSKWMSFLLEDKDDYEIYFSHQCDNRTFNRGAMKNIGFLAIKDKYPDDYMNMTFIFNDVDTMPFNKIFNYETSIGVVKHYYGYKYALGGIVVIKGSDFEKTNGYPCFWGWGMEDNALQKRCEKVGLRIDRSQFYSIGSPEILQLFDGISRIISKKDPWREKHDDGRDGLKSVRNLNYSIDEKSAVPMDNIFVINNPKIYFINITAFFTNVPHDSQSYSVYDLREPPRAIVNPNSMLMETKQSVVTTADWSKIDYYPTTYDKLQATADQLRSAGKPIPQSLLARIKIAAAKVNATPEDGGYKEANMATPVTQSRPPIIKPNTHNVPMHQTPVQPIPHKYSAEYAAYVGARPKATASPAAAAHFFNRRR